MTIDLDAQVNAVHAVFDATSSAWARGDADAFTDWYAEEASVILPGFALLGRAHVRAGMAAAFVGALEGSRRLHVVRDVRFLGADTALVVTRSVTVLPGEAEPEPAPELATWVLSLHDGRWLVEAYHSCPAPAET
ncbi:SgcJ/EcaC family oxidoreductase [Actinomadura sp. DC4]|uniref:SgcJ/EcaC family oxidoreductase n=1 Tax=Actinomadura sp. DC4 TaxID=3055069 RepID=UPI0025B0A347|nr:SgcJ/EcaC family oxidoreductase [Actinomadura sp. DC4]MDN3352051.1 SgcJ/EcaC family oxidoreductase [Actinomadura sp. DC4]